MGTGLHGPSMASHYVFPEPSLLCSGYYFKRKKIVQVLLFIAQKAVENEDPDDEP